LYEFDDIYDTVNLKNDNDFEEINLKHLKWKTTQIIKKKNESVEIVLSADTHRGRGINKFGLIAITVRTRVVSLLLIYEYK